VTACILVGAAPVRGLGRGAEVLLRLGLPYIVPTVHRVLTRCGPALYLLVIAVVIAALPAKPIWQGCRPTAQAAHL
jgi:hypothetical protein